ncbi:MAG TPA: AarF/UbiB family protein [Thermoanaerobaculia bacterium]|nr:AarF/UbiB family protein [Thermoanaerobaculia bacterium]
MKPVEPLRAWRSPGREVEECLARWELLRRPRPLAGSPAAEPFGRRLGGALQELGPVFSAFGSYLASRIDLLNAADCLELTTFPCGVPPMPPREVLERIGGELGRPAETVLIALEPEPYESRLMVQAHRARLADGRPVLVRLARPPAAERGLDRLPWLAGAFAVQGWSDGVLDEAIADFERSLLEGADLRSTAEALGLLAADAESFGLLVAPVVLRDLTTSGLLTVADPGGIGLAGTTALPVGAAWDLDRRREAARLVSVAWLRQALLGKVFPMQVGEAGVRVFADGRVTFLAGAFARPPAADRAGLGAFLTSLAAHEPDEACSHLLGEMTREPEASEESLRLLMRQAVPFRDGAWTASGESLAEHVFVCARQARECGFRPRRQLVAFFRGLASVAAAGRQLVPDGDALLDALQEVRVLASLAQMRAALSPLSPAWSDQLGRYAMLMSEMPRKLDEMLTLAAEGRARTSPQEASRSPRREEGSHLVLASVLLVMGAAALVLHRFVEWGALARRGEAVAATLFLVIGGILLWALTRNG